MKKFFSIALAFALMFTVFTAASFSQPVSGASNLTLQLPSYERVDPDLAKDAITAGQKVTGKELHGFNGQAYLKPQGEGDLTPKDVRGHDHKGIAILVDFPVTGAGMSDVPGVDYNRIPEAQFNDMLNGDVYNPYDLDLFSWLKVYNPPTDRTLKNYYNEVSYNQFGIDVDVVGWYELPHSYDYYLGQDKGYYNENGDAFVGELVKDAINLAKADGVNFADYAVPAKPGDFQDLYGNATSFTDENGNVVNQIVPNIFIIHRGTGAEYSLDPSIIWSHKWDILSAGYYGEYYRTGIVPDESTLQYDVVDGVVVNTYNIVPEVGQDISAYLKWLYGPTWEGRDPSPADVGVFAHEFGHVLGLPDEYDYGYESEGTGMFSLMAGGSWGRDINNRYFSGTSPTHMDAWAKYYLGFVTPIEIFPTDGVVHATLQPVETSKDIYKMVVPGSNGHEYFLIENRQQIGYDKGLSYSAGGTDLHGLEVMHIDEEVLMRNFDRPNEAANWDWNNRGFDYKDKKTGENHYGISILQADGQYDMEKGYNDGDAGDLFPGTKGITKLGPTVKDNPNSLSFYMWGTDSRSETGITINNIVENPNRSIDVDIYFAN